MIKRIVVVASLFLLITGVSHAGRPLSTDDAGTLGFMNVEVELGADYEESKEDDYETAAALAGKIGVLDNFDLGIEAPFLFLAPSEGDPVCGSGDLSVKAKALLFDGGEEAPSFALGLSNSVLTGNRDEGLGAEETEFTANFIVSKSFGSVSAHLNAAQTSIGKGEDAVTTFSLAFENNYVEGANAVAEIVNENSLSTVIDEDTLEEDQEFSSTLHTLFGFNWELTESFTADFGLRLGLSRESFRNSFTAGITYKS